MIANPSKDNVVELVGMNKSVSNPAEMVGKKIIYQSFQNDKVSGVCVSYRRIPLTMMCEDGEFRCVQFEVKPENSRSIHTRAFADRSRPVAIEDHETPKIASRVQMHIDSPWGDLNIDSYIKNAQQIFSDQLESLDANLDPHDFDQEAIKAKEDAIQGTVPLDSDDVISLVYEPSGILDNKYSVEEISNLYETGWLHPVFNEAYDKIIGEVLDTQLKGFRMRNNSIWIRDVQEYLEYLPEGSEEIHEYVPTLLRISRATLKLEPQLNMSDEGVMDIADAMDDLVKIRRQNMVSKTETELQ